MDDYRTVSRNTWAYLANHGCDSCLPYGPMEFKHARRWLDSRGWIPWKRINSVLCLACGGGQQGLLFASLGYNVTVFDLSPEQLAIDREAAARYGFAIDCREGDMQDLSALRGRDFDLVYQAVSACYVPDVRKMYAEVSSVLKPGGYYRVEHWNPVHIQLANRRTWDGGAYRIARPQVAGQPVRSAIAWDEETGKSSGTCWHYIHPLADLVGGLCDSGFVILRFAESTNKNEAAAPGSHEHLAAFLPAFFSMFARRRQGHFSSILNFGSTSQHRGGLQADASPASRALR